MERGEILTQCAEAIIYECSFYGFPAILKQRPAKAYRHPTLDERIRTQRTSREARALARCHRFGVPAPVVYGVDKSSCAIVMERVEGVTVRDFIRGSTDTAVSLRLLTRVGAIVALLHEGGMIHGDLTTSNFIVRLLGGEAAAAPHGSASAAANTAAASSGSDAMFGVTVIDFGLVRDSTNAEDRAVDLYVLSRAVASTHPLLSGADAAILDGYSRTAVPAKAQATLARLEAVRARGRKRSMLG